MGSAWKAGAVALATVVAANTAVARPTRSAAPSPKCAKADEVSAIQAAAVQQQLMVAALTCNEISRFNTFQTNFGPELRASDATLARMFKRLYGARGEAEYHAFKTRLANDSSIRSIHDNVNYCQQAGALFTSALLPAKPTLVSFVSVVQVVEESPVNSCELRVAVATPSGLPATAASSETAPAAAGPAPDVMPRPKPVVAAQATGLSGSNTQ